MPTDLSQPGYDVHVEEHVPIAVRDGVRLSALLMRPETEKAVPVLFSCDGYRKDPTRKRSWRRIGLWFAGRGYAFVLADIRGTGNSEGVAQDEYSAQELEDAYDVVEWLAAQPWSNGAVGMWGKSYSGFNAIQTAMLRPPHLRAIMPIYATDDRYTDDCHYWGGCRLAGGTIPYPLKMLYTNALPPDPAVYPDRWQEIWRQRVEQTPPWALNWWRQQTDDAYWRHGSLRPDYEAIEVPVFLVDGWRDGYTNSTPRMLANLRAPCKALIGPWGHQLPHTSTLEPRIDFLRMKLRWWDHWLKGIDTGLMDEPAVLYYMHDAHPPGEPAAAGGEWRTLDTWPTELEQRRFYLAPGALSERPPAESAAPDHLPWRLHVGGGEWRWCFYDPDSLPGDQRIAEPYALVYSSAPLAEPVEMLGQAKLSLRLSVTAPVAQLFARLCDVAPDGRSTHVSWAALNLTHRNSHSDPQPLEPGRDYAVDLEFAAVSWRFPPGHRLRLILSNHDWPRLWPAPQPFDLYLQFDREQQPALELPLAPAPARVVGDLPLPAELPGGENVQYDGIPYRWQLTREFPHSRYHFALGNGEEIQLVDGSMAESMRRRLEITVDEDDPGRNCLMAYGETTMSWPEVTAQTKARLRVAGTPTSFEFELEVEALADGERFSRRTWRESIPRRLI